MSEAITEGSVEDQNLESPEVSGQEKTEGERDVTPIDSAPVDANSESTQHSIGTRRLRRINKAPEEVRTAKRAEVTKNRSASSASSGARKRIKKASEIVGMPLADGRYKVKSQLGKGSMAYVFLAGDSRLETDVVIKVPKPEIVSTNDFRERFKRETQLLVKFSHPHVVSVLDIGEFEELPFVVMQLLSGGSLADQMKERSNDKGQMSPESLKEWLPGVARALDFCYRKGMVHRDVKPANILFDEDDNAFVADFGLSKVMYGDHVEMNSSETAAGIVLGTPNYISPEIVLAKEYDGRADQYSLGITVYHALLGRAPMQGQSATATMVNQTQKQLQLLSEIRSDVPEALAKAVRKSIEKNPENRFESCEAFAEAVVDSFRSPDGSSGSMVSAKMAAAPDVTAAEAKKSNASSGRRAPKKRNRSKGSGQQPVAAESGDMDWLAVTTDNSLPPRKGKARSAKAKKSQKPKAAMLNLFGRDVPVHIAAISGAGLAGLFLIAMFSIFFSSTEAPEPVTAVSADKNVVARANKAGRNKSAAKPAGKTKGNSKNVDRKNGDRTASKQVVAAKPVFPPAPLGEPGKNLWAFASVQDARKNKNRMTGVAIEILPLPEGISGGSDGVQIFVDGKDAIKNWAQATLKGADLLSDERIPNAASGLTAADMKRLQIDFDYSIPGSLNVSVSLESGSKSTDKAESSMKVDDTLRDNLFVDGHLTIDMAEAPIEDDAMAGFLRSMNSDTERADVYLKFAVQGRNRTEMPNESFIIRNVQFRLR